MNDPERASIDEDAENEFPPPRPPVKPALIIGVIALVMLIVAGGIFATTKFVGRGTDSVPTPTLVPGSNLFYVQTSPSGGNFFVDGQQLAHMPADPTVDLPLQLSAGVHQLTWQAEPFTQHCVIIVPPIVSETKCLSNDLVPIMKGPNKGLSAYLITFTASISDLTAAQQQPLFSAAQTALDALQSSDMVQPGEQYADLNAPQFTATATSTLRATLRYQLDISTGSQGVCVGIFFGFGSGCNINGQDCHHFCTAPGQAAKVPPGSLSVFGIVLSFWTYTTLKGQIVAQNQPDETDNLGNEFLVNLFITYASGQWRVTTKTPDNPAVFIASSPSCEAANYLVTQTDYTPYSSITPPGNPNDTTFWNTNDGANPAAGCLLSAIDQTSQNNTQTLTPIATPKPFARCLYRFGVLLALDHAAHTLWPNLPLADAYEQNIAWSSQA